MKIASCLMCCACIVSWQHDSCAADSPFKYAVQWRANFFASKLMACRYRWECRRCQDWFSRWCTRHALVLDTTISYPTDSSKRSVSRLCYGGDSIQTQLVHCWLPLQALHIVYPFACFGTWKNSRISVAPTKIYDSCHPALPYLECLITRSSSCSIVS